MTEEFGNSLQLIRYKLQKGLREGKGVNRVSPIPSISGFEIECDNKDIYIVRISQLPHSVLYPMNEVKESNRGSPSFRLNSVELEIETKIRDMVYNNPMSKKDIIDILKEYNLTDIKHVIKHSKGLRSSVSDTIYYHKWIQPDVEVDVGV